MIAVHRIAMRQVVAGGVLAIALMVAGCGPSAPSDTAGFLTVAVRTPPNNLDPRIGTDETSARVAQLVFGSLMDIGDDLRATPTLAERLDNPDPLTYIATLRRGVRFHDGHEFTARDVLYTYRQMLDPAYISPYKGAFKVLKSVDAPDDYTVVFTLSEPFAAFPIQLVTPPIVPAGADATLSSHPVGTGPYRFVRYAVDDQIVLARFDDYYEGQPKNPGIVMRIIPDDTMRGLEMRKRTADLIVNDMPPDIIHQFGASKRFTLVTSAGLDFMYLSLNTQRPALADRRVRQALAYAIDRRAIVDYLRRGLARQAIGLVPTQAWAFEGNVQRYGYDPAKAKALLDAAGYRDPDGDGPRPRLSLRLHVSTSEEYRLQATVIQQQLREVGVAVDILSLEFGTLMADVVKGNFDIVQMQWTGGALVDPDILRRVFHSQQTPPSGFNRGHYSNPEVDRLLDLASMTAAESDRKKYYGDVQKLVAEDSPYIGLWNRTNVVVAQPGLAGLHLNSTSNFSSLKDVVRH